MKIYLTRIILLLGLLCPLSGHADTTITVGGETITWNFKGFPVENLFGTGNCGYIAANDIYACNYGMTDPPYGTEITFTASLQPTSATYPALYFGYYDVNEQFHNVSQTQGVGTVALNLSTAYYIPASAKKFALIYHSDGSGITGTSIQINWSIADYDPVRANLLGGDDINPNTEYCDDPPQPGQPRLRKIRNKKGAGPGA
jgi:hypothetical protein